MKTHDLFMRTMAAGAITIATLGAGLVHASTPLAFNYQNIALSAMQFAIKDNRIQLSQVPASSLVSFFEPSVYQQYSGDEFTMRKAAKVALSRAERIAKTWKASGPYTINTTISFKPYDFTSHSFPLQTWNANSYYSVNAPYTLQPNVPWPAAAYYVFLVNPNIAPSLPMAEKAASSFVQNRTQYGSVNRTLYAVVTIKLLGFKQNVLGQVTAQGYFSSPPVDLNAKIEQVKLYADPNHTDLLHTYTANNSNTKKP